MDPVLYVLYCTLGPRRYRGSTRAYQRGTSTSNVMRWMDAAKILVLGRYAGGLDNWQLSHRCRDPLFSGFLSCPIPYLWFITGPTWRFYLFLFYFLFIIYFLGLPVSSPPHNSHRRIALLGSTAGRHDLLGTSDAAVSAVRELNGNYQSGHYYCWILV